MTRNSSPGNDAGASRLVPNLMYFNVVAMIKRAGLQLWSRGGDDNRVPCGGAAAAEDSGWQATPPGPPGQGPAAAQEHSAPYQSKVFENTNLLAEEERGWCMLYARRRGCAFCKNGDTAAAHEPGVQTELAQCQNRAKIIEGRLRRARERILRIGGVQATCRGG